MGQITASWRDKLQNHKAKNVDTGLVVDRAVLPRKMHVCPEPQKGILFGNGVFAEVIS